MSLGLDKRYKIIKKINPDVVQTWMPHCDLMGGIIARLAGIKNVYWGVHHSILVRGESKLSTILIVKLNSFLSKDYNYLDIFKKQNYDYFSINKRLNSHQIIKDTIKDIIE